MMKKKIPESILIGYLYDEISPHNKDKVERILKEDDEVKREVEELLETKKYLEKVDNEIEGEINFTFKKPRNHFVHLKSVSFYRWAAAIFFFFSVLLLLSGFEVKYSKGTFAFKVVPFWIKNKNVNETNLALQNLKKYIDERNAENQREISDALWHMYSKIESERATDKVMFKENIIQMRDLLLNVVDNKSFNAYYLKSKYKPVRSNSPMGGN